jgi:spoIIIJ-associated protein
MNKEPEEIEFEGNTLDEAINKAVLKLGVPKNGLNIKVVREEKRGLFGMESAKTAKIKVSIK